MPCFRGAFPLAPVVTMLALRGEQFREAAGMRLEKAPMGCGSRAGLAEIGNS